MIRVSKTKKEEGIKIMATFRDLSAKLRKAAKSIPLQANEFAKGTALEIVKELATNTPVDTSKAISNWKATLVAPYPSEVEPHYPGIYGSTYSKSVAETIAEAERNISKKKPGETIFITNNADYITELNNGSSKQAPAGFVERAVIVGKAHVSKLKFKF